MRDQELKKERKKEKEINELLLHPSFVGMCEELSTSLRACMYTCMYASGQLPIQYSKSIRRRQDEYLLFNINRPRGSFIIEGNNKTTNERRRRYSNKDEDK